MLTPVDPPKPTVHSGVLRLNLNAIEPGAQAPFHGVRRQDRAAVAEERTDRRRVEVGEVQPRGPLAALFLAPADGLLQWAPRRLLVGRALGVVEVLCDPVAAERAVHDAFEAAR